MPPDIGSGSMFRGVNDSGGESIGFALRADAEKSEATPPVARAGLSEAPALVGRLAEVETNIAVGGRAVCGVAEKSEATIAGPAAAARADCIDGFSPPFCKFLSSTAPPLVGGVFRARGGFLSAFVWLLEAARARKSICSTAAPVGSVSATGGPGDGESLAVFFDFDDFVFLPAGAARAPGVVARAPPVASPAGLCMPPGIVVTTAWPREASGVFRTNADVPYGCKGSTEFSGATGACIDCSRMRPESASLL